jgi:acyl carrier protein
MSTVKPIDKNAVYHATMLLMAANGKTSTLEIKKHLRDAGFWAKQKVVSDIMAELQAEHNWNKQEVGSGDQRHLEYSIEPPQAQQIAVAITRTTAATKQPLTPLQEEVIKIIKDSVWPLSTHTTQRAVELEHDLSTDLGMDHLNSIQIGLALDSKYKIKTLGENWGLINKVSDIVDMVVRLNPSLLDIAILPNPIFDRVQALLVDKLGCDKNEVDMTSNIINDLGADSLDCVEIIMDLEREFNIAIDDDDAENLHTVAHIVNYITNFNNPQPLVAAFGLHANNPISRGAFQKSRKPRKARTVINDSMNPSKSGRVTVNIDPIGHQITKDYAKTTFDPSDWFAYSPVTTTTSVYAQKYTSDNVRTAFARATGLPIQDVRARRIRRLS